MSIFKTFDTDVKKEVQGIPVAYPANDDGTTPTFYIAHASRANEGWSKSYERATRPYAQQIRLKTMRAPQWQEIALTVFLDSILKGWSDIIDENGDITGNKGEKIPFTRENALKLMERLPALYADLEERSTQFDLFRKEEIQQSSGNSEQS